MCFHGNKFLRVHEIFPQIFLIFSWSFIFKSFSCKSVILVIEIVDPNSFPQILSWKI